MADPVLEKWLEPVHGPIPPTFEFPDVGSSPLIDHGVCAASREFLSSKPIFLVPVGSDNFLKSLGAKGPPCPKSRSVQIQPRQLLRASNPYWPVVCLETFPEASLTKHGASATPPVLLTVIEFAGARFLGLTCVAPLPRAIRLEYFWRRGGDSNPR